MCCHRCKSTVPKHIETLQASARLVNRRSPNGIDLPGFKWCPQTTQATGLPSLPSSSSHGNDMSLVLHSRDQQLRVQQATIDKLELENAVSKRHQERIHEPIVENSIGEQGQNTDGESRPAEDATPCALMSRVGTSMLGFVPSPNGCKSVQNERKSMADVTAGILAKIQSQQPGKPGEDAPPASADHVSQPLGSAAAEALPPKKVAPKRGPAPNTVRPKKKAKKAAKKAAPKKLPPKMKRPAKEVATVWKTQPPLPSLNAPVTLYKGGKIYVSQKRKAFRVIRDGSDYATEAHSPWKKSSPTMEAWKAALSKIDEYKPWPQAAKRRIMTHR